MYERYVVIFKTKKAKNSITRQNSFVKTGEIFPLMAELAYCAFHTPPFINFIWDFSQQNHKLFYTFTSLVGVVMVGRVYLLFRVIITRSTFRNMKAESVW